jgi:hypothetical protein
MLTFLSTRLQSNPKTSAKVSPTFAQARIGRERLNPPLPPFSPLLDSGILASFLRFLKGDKGKGPVGIHRERFLGLPIHKRPQFCTELHEAMQLLCKTGAIELASLRGEGNTLHYHKVILKPIQNPRFKYEICSRDDESFKARALIGDQTHLKVQSNTYVDKEGKAYRSPGKPLSKCELRYLGEETFIDCTATMRRSETYLNELVEPIYYFYQLLAEHDRAYIRIEGAPAPRKINLLRQQDELPSYVVEGLNKIHAVLSKFNPNLSYTEPSHFS